MEEKSVVGYNSVSNRDMANRSRVDEKERTAHTVQWYARGLGLNVSDLFPVLQLIEKNELLQNNLIYVISKINNINMINPIDYSIWLLMQNLIF